MSASRKPGPKTAPDDETKRKFREALEAKRGVTARTTSTTVDNPHAHGPVETKRTFRRKTG